MAQNLPQIKVVMIGGSVVEKSYIIYRFLIDEFNGFKEANLGIMFSSKYITTGLKKSSDSKSS